MKKLLILPAALGAAYLLTLRGRTGHPGWETLEKFKYAHRGLHDAQKPENSMAAFRAALEKGYGIELDVHLLKDGELAILHDHSLKRTAGADVIIEDLTALELAGYRLEGTDEHIPLLREVLELFQGRAPLIVELKVAKENNTDALCRAVCDLLEQYDGPCCLESFDPRAVYWLRKNRPEFVRGQLSEDYLKGGVSPLPKAVQWVLGNNLVNFLTRPDFVAFHYPTRKTLSNLLCRKVWRLRGVSWTLKNREQHDTAVAEGWIPIFENFEP